MSDLPPTEKSGSAQHLIIVGLLIFLGSLIMVNASSVVDTARDVYNAWQIAEGTGFPLEGPLIGGIFHAGPFWFYLLAVPLWLSPNWVIMSMWVGLLTSMKYALAYACGARLLDRTFGLMWACLLALPDWTSFNYLIFSHTNLIETSMLLCLYALIRWQQGSHWWFPVLCLAIGLGIHAHPTVYAAGLITLPFVLRSLWRRELAWWMLPIGVLAAIFPFTPYLISQYIQHWPDLQTGKSFVETQPLWANLSGFWDVLVGTLFDGPVAALGHLLGLQGTPLYLAGLTLGLISVGGLACSFFFLIRGVADRVLVGLLLGTLLCIAAVATIRSFTPFYQTFVIYPSFYGLLAWGWWRFFIVTGFSINRLLVPISLITLCGFYWATFQMGNEGHLYLPQKTLMNVQAHETDEFDDAFFFPGWGRQPLGSFICNARQPVYFHGLASLVLEQSYAMEAKMRCAKDDIFMGGNGAGQHYLGISHRSAQHLNIHPQASMGSLGLYQTTKIVAPSESMPVPLGDVYPPRPWYQTGESELVLAVDMAQDEMLAVTNLYHFWMPYQIEVKQHDRDVQPLFRTSFTSYFGCMDCNPGENQQWSVTIYAPKPELVEVVTFKPNREAP